MVPKVRRRKAPITSKDAASGSSSSPRSGRTLIRRFHVLLKKKAQLESCQIHDNAIAKDLADVQREIQELGGLVAYQRMSSIGQGSDRGGGSEKVLIGWLKDLGMSDHSERERLGRGKLRLLEVGAVKPDNYLHCSQWIDSTCIDLHSRHPSILEQDFLLMDENQNRGKWDIISLSLVLNFVPEPKDRGRMLGLAHAMLAPTGHLFLALPLACVLNSRYLTFEHLKALMEAIGFLEIKEKWKNGGRMAYWLYRKQERQGHHSDVFEKKSIWRQGDRNNFSVLL